MGRDVFGTERFGCTVAGCSCTSYLSKIDAMNEEERVRTVVHHPRNSPEYVQCVCGHGVAFHRSGNEVSTPLAASVGQALRQCPTCKGRAGACRAPESDCHLSWSEAYCPKCFTKPNAKGCKKLGEDGHWTAAAAATATTLACTAAGTNTADADAGVVTATAT